MAPERRKPQEVNLIYWADSYDFLICYPVVSPLVNDVPNVSGEGVMASLTSSRGRQVVSTSAG
jgi:hypothetical protein